jgi:hypothetical protein
MNTDKAKLLYKHRKMSPGCPELEKLGVSAFTKGGLAGLCRKRCG